MHRLRSLTFLLSLLCCTVVGCKDADEVPPVVSVLSPNELAQFSVNDTIAVHFQVSDDRVVEQVIIKLVDMDFIAVVSQVTQQIGATQFEGYAALVVDNKQLQTGKYFVLVSATDGTNDQNTYREVRINALPFARRALYIGAVNELGQGSLFKIDSLFSGIQPIISIGQDVHRVCVDSQRDRVTVSGRFNGGIVQYDLVSGGVRWSAAASQQPPAVTYTDMVSHGGNVFVSLNAYELRAYTAEGALVLNRLTDSDRPHTLFANDAHLLVERRQNGTSANRLFVYRNGNFSLKHELNLSSMQIVAFCERNANEVFIFGNLNGQAKVWLYNMETNGYWEPRQLPEGRLLYAAKGEGQTYFLAHSSGLYHYTYSPNYLNSVRPNERYNRLVYDRSDGYLFASKGNTLDVLAGQQGALITTFANADSIVSMDIHYTK